MIETPHVGDIGTVIYLPTFSGTDPLDETLDTFTLRTVHLRPPGLAPVLTITDVPTEVDPLDNVKKLKLVTGTNTSLLLTGTGEFALLAAHVGEWLADIVLGHATGQWSIDPFPAFTLRRTLT